MKNNLFWSNGVYDQLSDNMRSNIHDMTDRLVLDIHQSFEKIEKIDELMLCQTQRDNLLKILKENLRLYQKTIDDGDAKIKNAKERVDDENKHINDDILTISDFFGITSLSNDMMAEIFATIDEHLIRCGDLSDSPIISCL